MEKCALSRRCSHVHKYVCDCVTCVLQCNSDKRMKVKNAYMSLSGFEHVSLKHMVQNMYEFFTERNFSLRNIHKSLYKVLIIIIVQDGNDRINNPRLPTTIYTGNVVLTSRPGGEESVHSCPWHLDHSELLTPDISLHPDDHSCSKPKNGLMESWTTKHGYVKIHFILVLKCASSCQL